MTASPSADGHLSVGELVSRIRERLDAHCDGLGAHATFEPIGEAKSIPDATIKLLVRAKSGEPAGVVICSQPAAPGLVARACSVAEEIRGLLGNELGDVIIRPHQTGDVGGLSYALLPWHRPFASSRLMREWHRLRLRRPLLNWLYRAAAVAASRNVTPDDESEHFECVLAHLESQPFLSYAQRAATQRALDRLMKRTWQPRHVFDHNDLWEGNVLLRESSPDESENEYPFVIIDWAGANPRGYGIYDLVRLAQSLRLSRSMLQNELHRHAVALQCEPIDTVGHFLAACGRLHMHLEHFPEERFFGMLMSSWDKLAGSISPS